MRSQSPLLLAPLLALAATCSRPTPSAVDAAVSDAPARRSDAAVTSIPASQRGSIEGTVTLLGPLPGLPAPPLALTEAQRALPGCIDAARRYAQPFDVSSPGPMPGALVAVEARDPDVAPPRDRRLTFRDCEVQQRVLFVSQTDRVFFHLDATHPILPNLRGAGNAIQQVLIPGSSDSPVRLPRIGSFLVNVQTLPSFVGAMIMVLQNRHLATTDGAGHFRIDDVPAGEHTIHAWFIATQESRAQVVVQPGQTAHVDFTLRYVPPPPPGARDGGALGDGAVEPVIP